MKAILWQERFSCNLKCPYCTIHTMKAKGDCKASWQEWVAAFNKIKPSVIDITGGEPFLNKNIIEIINGLESGVLVGLTTNLTFSIERFATDVSPKKAFSITASYHPSTTLIDKQTFIDRALTLKNNGFHVTVNFVAYPDQMLIIPELKKEIEGNGIRFHVDPYGVGNIGHYEYTKEQRDFLNPYVGADRVFRMNKDNSEVRCSGGRDYMMVDPDGYAYRCWAKHIAKSHPIGNIFDVSFKALDADENCSMSSLCGGCDRDKVTING